MRELLEDILIRAYERFERAFEDVDLEQVNAFPAANSAPQIKSMGWLAWHTAREVDLQIAHLKGTEPLWVTGNFTKDFDFLVKADEDGWNHSLEQAKAITVSSKESVMAYLKAAIDQAVVYIDSLDEDSLTDIVDESWTPAVTRGVRLVSIIDDASMHSGQVFYSRRLLGLED